MRARDSPCLDVVGAEVGRRGWGGGVERVYGKAEKKKEGKEEAEAKVLLRARKKKETKVGSSERKEKEILLPSLHLLFSFLSFSVAGLRRPLSSSNRESGCAMDGVLHVFFSIRVLIIY